MDLFTCSTNKQKYSNNISIKKGDTQVHKQQHFKDKNSSDCLPSDIKDKTKQAMGSDRIHSCVKTRCV